MNLWVLFILMHFIFSPVESKHAVKWYCTFKIAVLLLFDVTWRWKVVFLFCFLCFQRCCSLSATRWGISQTCWRTRWHQQALCRVPAPAAPPGLPSRRLRLPRLPPPLSIRAPQFIIRPRRHCLHSPCPLLLLLLLPRPHLLPPPLPLGNSWWPAAHPFFSRGLRWSRPSSHSLSRRPNLLSRYPLDIYLTHKSCLWNGQHIWFYWFWGIVMLSHFLWQPSIQLLPFIFHS